MQLTLKKARERKHLTVAELARRAGINKSTAMRIENGEVRPLHETVLALEDALELGRGTLVFPSQVAKAS